MILAWAATTGFGQSANTVPVGVVKMAVAAGTPSRPVTTSFAIPLTDAPVAMGAVAGRITAATTDTLSLRAPGWAANAFASPRQPYAVHVLSGPAAGRLLPIASNTADTLRVLGPELAEAGLRVDDAVEIVPLATLDSLFGASTFIGGPSAAVADVITIGTYTTDSYYYNTTARAWRRTSGRVGDDHGRIVVPPQSAIQVARVGPALTLLFFGRVPSTPFQANVARAGNTAVHSGYPTDVSLGELALQAGVAEWVSAPTAAAADTLTVRSGTASVSYFHNGTNWVEVGAPTAIGDGRVIRAGDAVIISRRGAFAGFHSWVRPMPYSLRP